MICFPCTKGNHSFCRNKTFKDGTSRPKELSTQCSCEHLQTGMIDPTQCKHLKIVEATRYCDQCRKSIPLTMTKNQAMAMLDNMNKEIVGKSIEERQEIISGYAERFLNDRPTHNQQEASAR